MRVILVQSLNRLSPPSGGWKANVAICQSLQRAGHEVLILGIYPRSELLKNNTSFAVHHPPELEVVRFKHRDLEVSALIQTEEEQEDNLLQPTTKRFMDRLFSWLNLEDLVNENEIYNQVRQFYWSQIAWFKPTHFICDEMASVKIVSMLSEDIVRVFLCHAVEHLPFGPYTGFPGWGACKSEIQTLRLARMQGIISVSKAVQCYIKEHGGLSSTVLEFPAEVFGAHPFPSFSNFHKRDSFVVAVNPGVPKGFHIFRDLAKSFPDIRFAAVEGWATSDHIKTELKKAGVKLLPHKEDVNELFAITKVLIVPSLWFEAFGLIVIDAMLRGIPVIASTAGGLPEAKLGVDYVVPVKAFLGETETDPDEIAKYGCYRVPEQDIQPWRDRLQELLENEEIYRAVSEASRTAALNFVTHCASSCSPSSYVNFLEKLKNTTASTATGQRREQQKSLEPIQSSNVLQLCAAR